jgi:hypothetical protein
VVNLVTKSGTNNLRGQVYEWYRGSELDARNFFDKRAGRPKRDYDDNRFGGRRRAGRSPAAAPSTSPTSR